MVLDPGVVFDFAGVNLGGVSGFAGAEQVVAFRHDAGADDAVAQRDVPEPAASREVGDGGGAFVQTGVALGVLIEGPDGDLVEHRVAFAGAVLALVEGVAAGAVEGDRGLDLEGFAVAGLGADAGDAVAGAEEFEDGGVLADLDAFRAGVVEEHEVEVLALDLPGGGGGVVEVLEEVEGGGNAAVGGGELDRAFADEADFVHPVDHAEAVEREPAEGHEGLAHVVAGEDFLFEEQDAVALHGEQGGGGGSGGAAADDDGVVIGHGREWMKRVEPPRRQGRQVSRMVRMGSRGSRKNF